MKMHWIDRVTAPLAPRWTFKRQQARLANDLLARHYEAASAGRRTMGWRRSSGDANAVIGPGVQADSPQPLDVDTPRAGAGLGLSVADHAGMVFKLGHDALLVLYLAGPGPNTTSVKMSPERQRSRPVVVNTTKMP